MSCPGLLRDRSSVVAVEPVDAADGLEQAVVLPVAEVVVAKLVANELDDAILGDPFWFADAVHEPSFVSVKLTRYR